MTQDIMHTDSAEQWPKILLAWFAVHRRCLPWREDKNPYRIWVSEIMLQQTRVEAVRPYFEQWLRTFPTMEAVAAATEDDVVKAWQGLGYYSRARNLQLGMQEVVTQYGGVIPQERQITESIRGIGPYTAGAILSIAFNRKEAAVDGNVLRIYARLYGVSDNILGSIGKNKITKLVEDTIDAEHPGDFNEALMDFGSAICIPKNPHCESCPLTNSCKAYLENNVDILPVRIKKMGRKIIPITIYLIVYNGRYLLHRRPPSGVLQSMWEFPSGEGRFARKNLEETLASLGIEVSPRRDKIDERTHTFSHLQWKMKAYRVAIREDNQRDLLAEVLPKDWRWVEPKDFFDLPWAGPHGKLTEFCNHH